MATELDEKDQATIRGLQNEIAGLVRYRPEGWEAQITQIKKNIADIESGGVVLGPSNSPVSMVKAAINRVPTAAGNTLQLLADGVNYLTGGIEEGPDGKPVRDRFGTPQRRPDLIGADFSSWGADNPPTSMFVQSPMLGNAVDIAVDTMMFSVPTSPGFTLTAKALNKIPGLRRITNPFTEFNMVDDFAMSGISGFSGGLMADEVGDSNLAAEILAPLGIQTAPGLAMQFMKRRSNLFRDFADKEGEAIAARLLKDALDQSGLDIDEAIRLYRQGGDEMMIADLDDAFRTIVREARSQGALTGADARALRRRVEGDTRNPTKTGSVGRLNQDINRYVGTMDGNTYINNLRAQSQQTIKDLYQKARVGADDQKFSFKFDDYLGAKIPADIKVYLDDMTETVPEINDAIERVKKMNFLKNRTTSFEHGFDFINMFKQAIDDQIRTSMSGMGTQQKNFGRSLIEFKKNFMEMADAKYPGYKEARDAFAGVQQLEDAVRMGRDLYKLDPELLAGLSETMSTSEMNAFMVGARDQLLQQVLVSPSTGNAGRRLVKNADVTERLKYAIPDETARNQFLSAIEREGEFARTRNFIMGGSQTFDKYQAAQSMHQNVRGILAATFDPTGLAQMQLFANMVESLTRDKGSEVFKQGLVMANDILLNSNLSAERVREALTSGNVRKLVEPTAIAIWGAENVPKHMLRAIRGTSMVEAAEYLTKERDQAELDAEREGERRRQSTANQSRDLSPMTYSSGI